jgi:hypothetical protein
MAYGAPEGTARSTGCRIRLRIPGFVIPSSFVIRASSFHAPRLFAEKPCRWGKVGKFRIAGNRVSARNSAAGRAK